MRVHVKCKKNIFLVCPISGPAAAASAAASDEPAFEIPKELRDDKTLKAFVDVAEVIKKTALKSGTKENPAETCRDLALAEPDLPNGKSSARLIALPGSRFLSNAKKALIFAN